MSAQMLTSLLSELFPLSMLETVVSFFSYDDEDEDFDDDSLDDDSFDDDSFDGDDETEDDDMWFNNEEEWDKY